MENIRKKMARRLGKHGFQTFMSRFHDLRKEVNIKAFEEGWAALPASLLPTHQWAYTYLHNTWGGEHCKYWATCYHNAVEPPQPGLIIQKVDTFAVSLQKKKAENRAGGAKLPPRVLWETCL